MNKKFKRIMTLALALGTLSVVSPIKYTNLFLTKAYADDKGKPMEQFDNQNGNKPVDGNQGMNNVKTGWMQINGVWYFFDNNGQKKTGWLQDKGKWYYLQPDGAMAANTVVDGYRLGPDGAWIR